ncbi:MAG TPA: hypothetical protein P5244_04785 [Syntrophales bacterium]|jgi:hypothetical protein|nr:hypothetical protein [Syntrophales bacterium]
MGWKFWKRKEQPPMVYVPYPMFVWMRQMNEWKHCDGESDG